MSTPRQINERSTAYLTASFFDADGQPAAPSSVTYSVYCMTSGQQLRAATSVTPAATVTIQLGATDTLIVGPANAFERRRVTVSAIYGADDELHQDIEVVVRNLNRVAVS